MEGWILGFAGGSGLLGFSGCLIAADGRGKDLGMCTARICRVGRRVEGRGILFRSGSLQEDGSGKSEDLD